MYRTVPPSKAFRRLWSTKQKARLTNGIKNKVKIIMDSIKNPCKNPCCLPTRKVGQRAPSVARAAYLARMWERQRSFYLLQEKALTHILLISCLLAKRNRCITTRTSHVLKAIELLKDPCLFFFEQRIKFVSGVKTYFFYLELFTAADTKQ